MPIWRPNWKVKLTNNKTAVFGNQGGTYYDDLDKVASALGVSKDKCAEIIINIKVKKATVMGGSAIDSVQFVYLVETKDKTIDVEGYKHGGSGGGGQPWDFGSDYLLKINGEYWDYGGQWYICYLECKSFYVSNYDIWSSNKGSKTDKNQFTLTAPACFFSRVTGNMLAGLGAYEGQLYNADLEIAGREANKYKELYDYWNSNGLRDIFDGKTLYPDGFKVVKDKLTTLSNNQEKHTPDQLEKHKPEDLKPADYDTIKTNLTSLDKEWNNLDNKPLNADNLKVILADLKKIQEVHKKLLIVKEYWDANLKGQFGDKMDVADLTKIKTELDSLNDYKKLWKKYYDTFDTFYVGETPKDQADKISSWWNDAYKEWNADFATKYTFLNDNGLIKIKKDLDDKDSSITTLTNENEKYKKREQIQGTINDAWKTAFGDTYGDRPNLGSIGQLASKLTEKDAEITKLNQQLTQQGNQASQGTQYLNKLLTIYKTEITDETIAFYQSLKIVDNNEINEKYGNRDVSYSDKLKELKGESEPEQVISAFKYVALILATEKSQKESDKWINNPVAKQKPFRQSKFNTFNKVKEAWDNMEGTAEPTELNNPLYLPIIKDKETYKNQIENIIKLWL